MESNNLMRKMVSLKYERKITKNLPEDDKEEIEVNLEENKDQMEQKENEVVQV